MELEEFRDIIRLRMTDYMSNEVVSYRDAFLAVSLNNLVEYGITDGVVNLDMQEDIKAGSKLIHADGYSFDETDHSVSLYICDYEDSFEPDRLTAVMLDRLYWRLMYFLETACSDTMSKYMDINGKPYKAALLIKNRMNRPVSDPERILKIHFVILTNRELDTRLINQDLFDSKKQIKNSRKTTKSRKKIKRDAFQDRPLDIDLWPVDRFLSIESSNNSELTEIDFLQDFDSEGIPCLKGNIGDSLPYEAYIGIIAGKLLADIYIEYGSRVLEGNVRAFLGTKSAKGVNNGIKRTINNEPSNFFTYNNGIAVTATEVTKEFKNGQLFITGMTDLQIINGGQTTATLAEAVLKKTNPTLEGIYVPIKLTVISDREKETEEGILVYDQMVHDIARFANSQNKVTAADLFSNDPFHVWMEKASKRYLAPTAKYNIQTGWYYERARKKYQQEQMQLKGDDVKRFQAKYPRKQIITKEQLAMYLTAIAAKPHLCSKGKNWVMKEYGAEIGEIYKKDKARFNEYYFKKCVCAAIIYLTVDNYLESNKRNPDFWYSAGGYKGNIVPYTISKIMVSLPSGYTLNWMQIWNKQEVSPAFMKEIEKVTLMANEYFCTCSGVLVSEHCKKESTWLVFRDEYKYVPSSEFIGELISLEMDKEQSKNALHDQKETNELKQILDVMGKGERYWQDILDKAIEGNVLSSVELNSLREIISFIHRGNIPVSSSGKVPARTRALINNALIAEGKLNDEGVVSYFDADDDIYELTIADYKMH